MINSDRDYYTETRDIIEDWLESGVDKNELIEYVKDMIQDYEIEE